MCSESQLTSLATRRLGDVSVLGDPRRRRILSILLARSQPITVPALVDRLAAREAGVGSRDVPPAERQSLRLDLRHRCLPQLAAAGWIERRAEGVAIDGHPPTELEIEELSLPALRSPDHPDWDAIEVVLTRPRRLELISLVAAQPEERTLSALVADLPAREDRPWSWPTTRRELCVTLHHVDLPKLAAVELVAYDADERTVADTPRLAAFVERTGLECD